MLQRLDSAARNFWTYLREHPHRALAWLWVLLTIPAMLWWAEAVWFVILISLYANWETSKGADEAHTAKKEQREQQKMISEMYAKLIGETPSS